MPHFDFAMAEGVIKTYRKEYERAFTSFVRIAMHMEARDAAAFTEKLLASVDLCPRLGNMEEFGHKLDQVASAEQKAMVGEAHAYAAEEALKYTCLLYTSGGCGLQPGDAAWF